MRVEILIRSFSLPAWLTSWLVMANKSAWVAGQAGFSTVGLLLGGGAVILIVVVFVTRGIPVIYGFSSNTTAMVASGMDAPTIQYWTWGMWAIIIIVVIGIAMVLVKKYGYMAEGGGGGGGGGYGRRRRR